MFLLFLTVKYGGSIVTDTFPKLLYRLQQIDYISHHVNMSAMYPSLEDMKVDQMAQAQQSYEHQAVEATRQGATVAQEAICVPASSLYPVLDDYMGLSAEMMAQQMAQNQQVVPHYTTAGQGQVAPITGDHVGLKRAEIKQGVRELLLCKDGEGKMGLRVCSVNKGVFVSFVYRESPAAMVGLRFGDQVLQVNGEDVAGWSTDKAMKYLKKCPPTNIRVAVRDRPFERTLTLQKDSTGYVGFVFKDNKITSLVKGSSAARNGLLIDHHMVEVNGQNVVGLTEVEIKKLFDGCGRTVTVTIIPSFIYEHIVKSIGSKLVRKHMDHGIPEV
ncbi:Syntenin-1 [Lamellibrachia satsuma]|nr:Syntenin-1 [Lamellibrachia satsuma]